jgi:hypothetical protein
MLKTVWKPKEEVKFYLRNAGVISVLACDSCAKACGTGGTAGIEVLKGWAKEWGKEVVLADCVRACCVEDLMRQTLQKDPAAISRSDTIVVVSCASGVKSAFLCDPGKPVVGALDSLGCSVFTLQDTLLARSICKGCGKCTITYTGGLCTSYECPSGTKYGPCKKSPTEGMTCGVDGLKDCVWKEIGKKSDLAGLKELALMHGAA